MEPRKRTPREIRPAIRLLVVDDHPIARAGYQLLLAKEADFEICGEAEDSAAGLQLAQRLQPDLAIVEVALRCGNGIEMCRQITRVSPHTKVFVVSAYDEIVFAERVLHAGARGFLTKTTPLDRLLESFREVADGQIVLSPEMNQRLLARMTNALDTPSRSALELLSDRELTVFELIGRGLTNRRIASQLHLSHKTIESYRDNLKKKLKVRDATELTQRAVLWVIENTNGHSGACTV